MAKDKSFFQKLTSAVGADDEWQEDDPFSEEDYYSPEEKGAEEQTEKAEPEIKTAAAKTAPAETVKTQTKQAISPQRKPLEEEGQLTIDVYQTDDDIVIKSTIAGVNPEDLDVNITNEMVTIRGERSKDEEVKQENYYYRECYWGAFSRSVILPTEIDPDGAEANLKNGILTVRLPKIKKEKERKLKITAS